MSFLGLFGSGDETDGCGGHHFTEYRATDTLEVETWSESLYDGEWMHHREAIERVGRGELIDDQRTVCRLLRVYKATCEHDGCSATDTEQREYDRIVLDDE